jgi:hypothetical protein
MASREGPTSDPMPVSQPANVETVPRRHGSSARARAPPLRLGRAPATTETIAIGRGPEANPTTRGG